MPSNFDTNKYKKIFESRYGSGSYESGLSNARSIGATKAQADFEKEEYKRRLNEYKAAQKNKTTQDAVSSWADPSSNSLIKRDGSTLSLDEMRKNGAYRTAEEIRNDPYLQQQVKDKGYSVQEYVDSLYEVLSNGQYYSEKHFNNATKDLKEDTNRFNKARDKKVKEDSFGLFNSYQEKYDYDKAQEELKKTKKDEKGFLDRLENLVPRKKSNEKTENWYTKAHEWVDDKVFEPIEDKAGRFFTNMSDAMTLNQFKKSMDGKDNPEFLEKWASPPTTKAEKATDFAGQMAGMVAPIGAAYRATGAAAKPITNAITKSGKVEDLIRAAGITKGIHVNNPAKVVESAVRGGLGMGAYSATREGVDEVINPDDANLAQRVSQVGLETALGMAGDPAVRALGPLIKNSPIGQKIYSMIKSRQPQQASEAAALPAPRETLGLPEPQARPGLPEPQGQLPAPARPEPSLESFNSAFRQPRGLTNPIPEMPDIMRIAANRGRYEQAGVNFAQSGRYEPKARHNLTPVSKSVDPMNRGQVYWQGRYEEFAKQVNDNYDINQMTPEALDDLWSSFARYDEPVTLENAVDLAYPKGFEPPTASKVPESAVVPEAPKVQESIPAQEPPVSRPATLEEMFQNLRETAAANAVPEPSLEPLQFRRQINPESIQTPTNGGNLERIMNQQKQDKPLFMKLSELNNQPKQSNVPAVRNASVPSTQEATQALQVIENQIQLISNRIAKNPSQRARLQPVLEQLEKEREEMLLKLNLQQFADGSAARPLDQSTPSNAPRNNEPKEIKEIKDITQFQTGTTDLYRLADRLPNNLKNRITTALDEAKQTYVQQQERLTNDLYEKVVKGLGIKKGTKDSALVQDFGEKTLAKKVLEKQGRDLDTVSAEELQQINMQELQRQRPNDWQKIVAADNYFRQTYDSLIDQVNAVRSKIYPNDPEKIVPKRSDYYHHFNELEGFEGVKNMFDTPANIDPHLEGISPYTRPKTKFQGFMQKRGIGKYKSDAVGGYLKYLKAASHSINLDPVIPVLRKTANELADATTNTRNANKIIETLEDFAKDFAGKTNPYDRLGQKVFGRKGMGLINWANSRVKANMILGNLSSAIGQLGSIPLGVGKAKWNSIPAIKDSMELTAKELGLATAKITKANQTAEKLATSLKDMPVYKSQFLKERYLDVNYRRFDQRLIEQPKRLAAWLIETADKSGSRYIWNAMYQKGLKEKVKDPIKYADREARNIIAGRGVGEVPLAQKSKTVQVLAPFTLEVGNQWRVLREMVGEKDASGILTFLIASFGINKAMEQVRGSGISYDPIDAMIDGYNRKDGDVGAKVGNAAASLLGETVGNIPGGNLLTQFANTDKKVPLFDIRYSDLFGERNPNRFGTGLTMAKALQDPLYAALPFGAAQVRKTTRGLDAILSDGVYKGDTDFNPLAGEETELQYPIDTTPLKNLQMLMMGPTATSEAREYYNNDRRPLSEKQTQQYQLMEQQGAGDQYYQTLLIQRQANNLQTKIKEVRDNPDLTMEQKQAEILRLMEQLQNLQK
jgi:hypothetical protein